MLEKFEVYNFMGFKDNLVFDFHTSKKYTYNTDLVQKSIIKKALVFGENSSGKSNLCYALMDIIFPAFNHTWLFFIYAIPVTAIVLLVLTSVWKKKITTAVIISVLIWSLILSIYFTLYYFLPTPPKQLWEVFLIGIPLQVLLVFWSIYRKIK